MHWFKHYVVGSLINAFAFNSQTIFRLVHCLLHCWVDWSIHWLLLLCYLASYLASQFILDYIVIDPRSTHRITWCKLIHPTLDWINRINVHCVRYVSRPIFLTNWWIAFLSQLSVKSVLTQIKFWKSDWFIACFISQSEMWLITTNKLICQIISYLTLDTWLLWTTTRFVWNRVWNLFYHYKWSRTPTSHSSTKTKLKRLFKMQLIRSSLD